MDGKMQIFLYLSGPGAGNFLHRSSPGLLDTEKRFAIIPTVMRVFPVYPGFSNIKGAFSSPGLKLIMVGL